jgi:hypothetical protein
MLSVIFAEYVNVEVIFILAGLLTVIVSLIGIKTTLFQKNQQVNNEVTSGTD